MNGTLDTYLIGPVGVEATVEAELSVYRIAFDASVTPVFGHRDYNSEFPEGLGLGRGFQRILGGTDLPGIDVGYNRETRSIGATVDLRRIGSFGAHIGCRTKICIFRCASFKLGRRCRRRRSPTAMKEEKNKLEMFIIQELLLANEMDERVEIDEIDIVLVS